MELVAPGGLDADDFEAPRVHGSGSVVQLARHLVCLWAHGGEGFKPGLGGLRLSLRRESYQLKLQIRIRPSPILHHPVLELLLKDRDLKKDVRRALPCPCEDPRELL